MCGANPPDFIGHVSADRRGRSGLGQHESTLGGCGCEGGEDRIQSVERASCVGGCVGHGTAIGVFSGRPGSRFSSVMSVRRGTVPAMTNMTGPAAPPRHQGRSGSTTPGNNPRQNLDGSKHSSAGSLIGYCRVSTSEQNLDRQLDALREAGCDRIFEDHGVSGMRGRRPGLDACLDFLRDDDTLVIQSLDRLGRKTTELLRLVDDLAARDISLRILNLGIDTSTPAGQMVLSVMAALAQMERDILVERTRDGIAAARARGRVGGRPRVLTEEQVSVAVQWRGEGKSWEAIARLLGTSERTIRRRVGEHLVVQGTCPTPPLAS